MSSGALIAVIVVAVLVMSGLAWAFLAALDSRQTTTGRLANSVASAEGVLTLRAFRVLLSVSVVLVGSACADMDPDDTSRPLTDVQTSEPSLPTEDPTPALTPTAKATTAPQTAAPAPDEPQAQSCHPSYRGACLDPNSPDYDCAGGSGDGPDYTGRVEVVGPDEYGLDRDGDGVACESS